MGEINGSGADLPAHVQAQIRLTAHLRPVVTAMVNGALVMSQAHAPVDRVMVTLCALMGQICGGAASGDLASVLRLRAEMKDCFDKAMNAMPVRDGLPPPPANAQVG